jgi:hypothetical protein
VSERNGSAQENGIAGTAIAVGRYAAMHQHASSPPSDAAPAADLTDANRVVVFEAIARRMCVDAVYNRMMMRLSPHILYTRHDDLSRDGQPPRELKIGTFKLSGLRDMVVTEVPFVPQRIFDPSDARYRDVTLFAV